MTDFASPTEESMVMTERVRLFLDSADADQTALPWDARNIRDTRGTDRAAKIKAIEEHLGMFPDGDTVPLTLRQRLFFKNSKSKLVYKIRKVRRKCAEIVKFINSLQSWEGDIKNTRLVRHFILECLSPFKRRTLELTNATYDLYPAKRASWPLYIGSWIFISGTLIFFIYWIFAWGVIQGDENLRAWCKIYGTSAAVDIFLVQITKIFVLYYIPSKAMQPQLIRIRKVLADITLNYINRNNETNYSGVDEPSVSKYGLSSEISVVQHMSAACRAARSRELECLPSAWLLRQVSQKDLI